MPYVVFFLDKRPGVCTRPASVNYYLSVFGVDSFVTSIPRNLKMLVKTAGFSPSSSRNKPLLRLLWRILLSLCGNFHVTMSLL